MTTQRMLATPGLRHIAAAQILEEAHATLARTQNIRAELVERTLRIARENIRRLAVSPTEMAQRTAAVMQTARANLARLAVLFPTREDELRQQVARFRQERAARILESARTTLRRTASQRRGDPLTEERQQRKEPPPKPRKLDSKPIDWHAEIKQAVDLERMHWHAVLPEVIAAQRAEIMDDVRDELRRRDAEISGLRATLAKG